MVPAFGIALGLVVLFYLGRIAFESSTLEAALQEARSTGDPTAVVESVLEAPADKRPAKWDHAIDQLWQAYARETAAKLVVAAAEESDATILQYWIRQVLEVEPGIADEVFTDEFLREHYKPDVAARCGKSGCCG